MADAPPTTPERVLGGKLKELQEHLGAQEDWRGFELLSDVLDALDVFCSEIKALLGQ